MHKQFFADLHIHVGMSESGKWVKIPTSRRLTVRGIMQQAVERKGMDIIGIVDALSPLVQTDIMKLLAEGELAPVSSGGYIYRQRSLLLVGAEIETKEAGGGLAHTLIFMPDIKTMASFSTYMSPFIRNINLSSQNAHMPLRQLINIAGAFDALIIPAHVFTPHKSVYGVCCRRLRDILNDREMDQVTAIELGLSADSDMADRIGELARYTFITNSDAHSLDKIAREYNVLALAELSFQEVARALAGVDGRGVQANYGLDPRLGKYHHTFCLSCGFISSDGLAVCCPQCSSRRLVKGVSDRIEEIGDYAEPHHPPGRPRYFYQIPLEFIPGLGKKNKDKLLTEFKTEMHIMHNVSHNELVRVAGGKIADFITDARSGKAAVAGGGGGIYGKLLVRHNEV